MVTALFKEGQKAVTTTSLHKYDYGEVLRIKGLSLPQYVAVQFAVDGMSEALPSSIGETVEGVTDVLIPNSLLRSNINPWNYNIMAYVYIVSGSSGKTEYIITIPIKWRPKTGDDQAADDDVAAVIGSAVEKMNTATQRAETAASDAETTAAEIAADREQIQTNTADISSLKGDLADLESASETTYKDVLYVTDKNGNVIAKVGEKGVDSVGFLVNGEPISGGNADIIDEYASELYITDNNGNVILKVDKDGLKAVGIGEKTDFPYAGKELISIGDSLSTGGKWQGWLAKWTGCNFDENINTNGEGEHPAMSIGGTAIMPEVETSIYMRSLHVQYYNPDIIVIYAGQNDGRYFYMGGNSVRDGIVGSIDDAPYKKTVIYSEVPESEWSDYTCQTGEGAVDGAPTVYAAAMGMIENIMEACPEATIRCLSPMYMWCEVPNSSGYTTEQPPYRPILAKMWEEICEKYNIKLVNMWKDSGVNKYNASSYYNGVGNVHFNDYGNRRVAECIYNTL